MPINWQDKEVNDRILAAIIASFDGNINCREVARYFGGEATYNAIENFLRKPKKKAIELKQEAQAQGRNTPAPSPARPRAPKKAPVTPKKTDGVKTGRVTKGILKKKASPIKNEIFADDDEEVIYGETFDDTVKMEVDDEESDVV